MCTVTYIPTDDGFVLTSNRDEQTLRSTFLPDWYNHNQQLLIYPKDKAAGGTWIAANKQGKVACLLNGAFENHIKKDKYRKSRGQLLLESFDYENNQIFCNNIDLTDIEPFTLILIEGLPRQITEMRWDGAQKYIKSISVQEPRIWSSATLYSKSIRLLRRYWFFEWLQQHKSQENYHILKFHQEKHSENANIDIVMQRNNNLQTVSISQIHFKQQGSYFYYQDMIQKSETIYYL